MNTTYPFDLIPAEGQKPAPDIRNWLKNRPFVEKRRTLKGDAARFVAGEALAAAMNTAIAVGDPLLLTGEPGTGKTQAAYYAAHHLGVECIHFQVKSDSQARDLLYDFDMVRYFRDAHQPSPPAGPPKPQNGESTPGDAQPKPDACADARPDKNPYIEKRALWQAFETAEGTGLPQVLLIDEIDKAPGTFPTTCSTSWISGSSSSRKPTKRSPPRPTSTPSCSSPPTASAACPRPFCGGAYTITSNSTTASPSGRSSAAGMNSKT